MTLELIIILSLLFFAIATIYSSAGFGGGSSYLAILAFFSVDFLTMKTIALICNIMVVSSNLYVFSKNDLFNFKKALPLILISIPLAFLGGLYNLDMTAFFIVLGVALILAGILLFVITLLKHSLSKRKKGDQIPAVASAGGIGLLSGLVGIGGGIFLSPVLNLINWDDAKKIAATASFFILCNSTAGLAGHFIRTSFNLNIVEILPLIIAVGIGGQFGVRITTFKLKSSHVRVLTGALVFAAGLKILSDYL